MTKGFTFRLQSVLRLRIDAQQKQQRTVADAQLALRALEDEQSAIERDGQAARSELSQHLSTGNLDANWLRLNALHVQALQLHAADLIGKIHLARQALTSAQEQLAAATAHRKSLEKLRERQHEHFRAAEQRRERNAQDEIAAHHAQVNHSSLTPIPTPSKITSDNL